MHLNDLYNQIFISLRVHKLRTCLAIFGITWGTISVILLLAISNGFYEEQMKSLAFLQNATIFGWPGVRNISFQGLPQGQKIHVEIGDFNKIMAHISNIKTYTPIFNNSATLHYLDKNIDNPLLAVGPSFQEIQQLLLTPYSRFINKLDIKNLSRVVILSDYVKTILFGTENPLGKTILIGELPFSVIGVTAEKQSSSIKFMENGIYIPYSTYTTLTGKKDIQLFFILPKAIKHAPQIKNDLMHIFAAKYRFDVSDTGAVHIPDLAEGQLFITWFFRIVAIFLGCSGVFTLSVGGLGCANMMFLIVTERTPEIGLRMALGADSKNILLLFISETLFIVGLGGFFGFLISITLLWVLRSLSLPEWLGVPTISIYTMLFTIFILMGIGLLSGYFPARRAAVMKPVKALAFRI